VVDALVIVTVVATFALAVYGIVETARGRSPGKALSRAVWATEALLFVQAAIAAVRVLAGVRLPEIDVFLIYLAVSVLVLPVAYQWATAGQRMAEEQAAGERKRAAADKQVATASAGRWGGAVVAVAAIGVAVAVLRLQGLWAAGGG
jgi:hypothetical protein